VTYTDTKNELKSKSKV